MTLVIRPSKPPTGRSAARKETTPLRAPRRRCRRPAGRRFVGTLTFKFLGGGGGGGLRMQLASWRQFTTRQWPRARDCGTQARAFLMPAPPPADSLRDIETILIKAKFHYTGPTGPARTRTDFFARPGPQTRVSGKVSGLCLVGSGRARVVEFSYYGATLFISKRQTKKQTEQYTVQHQNKYDTYCYVGMLHHLGLYCLLFRRVLIAKINVALQLTKL